MKCPLCATKEMIGVRYVSWEHDPYGWLQSALNRLGFPHNRLTQLLMGMDGAARWRIETVLMGAMATLAVAPSVVLAVISWAVGRGAIMELRARKTPLPRAVT